MKKLTIFNRLSALLYDIILQFLLAIVVLLGFNYLNKRFFHFDDIIRNVIMIIAYFVLFILLFTVLPKKLKGTLGKYFAELEVITNHGKITFGRWLFREFVFKYFYPYLGIALTLSFSFIKPIYLAIYLAVGLGIEIIFIIMKRKTIHDYFLKTAVVKRTDANTEKKKRNR